MSLKSIRESYSRLLDTFSGAGVKLNESQKADLDTFVLALESKMGEQRRTAIRQTKKAVEKKMEREYRKVFESVMASMQENAELASKIQDRITRIKEQRKMAGKVNDYLDLYVESVLPKKTVVDYDRMRRLEKINESLREVLCVNDDAVQTKVNELEESYKVKKSKCETDVAKLQARLNESLSQARRMKAQIERYKAHELLESKVKDLPSYEARRLRRALSESSVSEIKSRFDKILESVRRQVRENKPDEDVVDEEIQDILDCDDVKEDDIMGRRAHNGYSAAPKNKDDLRKCDPLHDRAHNGHKPLDEEDDEEDISEEDEDFETIEEIQTDDDGDVQLDESDIIDRRLMKIWRQQCCW